MEIAQTAISVKSRDLRCKTYQNEKTFKNVIKQDINKIAGTKFVYYDGQKRIVQNLELNIVIPNMKLSSGQINAINSAIAEGKKAGVIVTITALIEK